MHKLTTKKKSSVGNGRCGTFPTVRWTLNFNTMYDKTNIIIQTFHFVTRYKQNLFYQSLNKKRRKYLTEMDITCLTDNVNVFGEMFSLHKIESIN